MDTLITLLLALCIITGLFFLFYRLKTPYYRVDYDKVVHILEMVLTGQATENDWQMTFGMTIRHDESLEAIRQQCLAIEEQYYIGLQKPPYLFSSEGLAELEQILSVLKQTSVNTANKKE